MIMENKDYQKCNMTVFCQQERNQGGAKMGRSLRKICMPLAGFDVVAVHYKCQTNVYLCM